MLNLKCVNVIYPNIYIYIYIYIYILLLEIVSNSYLDSVLLLGFLGVKEIIFSWYGRKVL